MALWAMFSGPPLPLPPNFPVGQLLPLLSKPQSGAWFRESSRNFRLHVRYGSRNAEVLIAGDLGLLLRRCAWVVVLEGAQAVLLHSELLIQWRALQVVTGTPYLPCPHHLTAVFPGAEVSDLGFEVPIRRCPPETVLAQCLTQRIPVAATHIIYHPPSPLPSG